MKISASEVRGGRSERSGINKIPSIIKIRTSENEKRTKVVRIDHDGFNILFDRTESAEFSTLLAGWPDVIFPSAEGITLTKGITYNIQWKSVRVDPVDILLCTENIPGEVDCFHRIAHSIPNNGSYPWTVPSNLPNRSNYVIGVGIVGVSVAFSDNPFAISNSVPDASWSVGSWGDCSVTCGGGYKTRDVHCEDSLGNVIPNSYCSGTKPYPTTLCNTHPCPKGMPWLPSLLLDD